MLCPCVYQSGAPFPAVTLTPHGLGLEPVAGDWFDKAEEERDLGHASAGERARTSSGGEQGAVELFRLMRHDFEVLFRVCLQPSVLGRCSCGGASAPPPSLLLLLLPPPPPSPFASSSAVHAPDTLVARAAAARVPMAVRSC